MKKKEKAEAIKMRKNGESINTISQKLDVSKSSVSLWVRDVELSENQIRNLKSKSKLNFMKGHKVFSENRRRDREKWQDEGRLLARESEKFRLGCMLYWGEGTKEGGGFAFCNSDIDMMTFFMDFLRSCFVFDENKIQLSVNAYTNNGLSEEEIKNFWIEELKLDKSNLRKCYFKSGEYGGKHKYGICTIRLGSVKIRQMIFGGIQEIAKFERKKWLR